MPSSSSSVIPVELNNGGTVTTRSLEFRGKTYLLRQEPSSHNHGLVVWDAAIALLDYVRSTPKIMNQLYGKRILELGAGTGIVGIVLQDFTEGNIIVTDLPSVVPNLQANVAANAHSLLKESDTSSTSSGSTTSSIKVLPYCWGDNYDELLKDGPVDCIVASDVTYSASLNPLLLRTTAKIALASENLRKNNAHGTSSSSSSSTIVSSVVPSSVSEGTDDSTVNDDNTDLPNSKEDYESLDKPSVRSPSSSKSTPGPGSGTSSCTIYFANEVRDEIAQQVFDTEAEKYFQVTRIPSRSLPLEWKKNSTMRLFKLKVKRNLTIDDVM